MSYQQLHDMYAEIGDLEHAEAMLSWDEAVMMPAGGGERRANSLATLAAQVHRRKSDPRTEAMLTEALADQSLDQWQSANLREMKRSWQAAVAVPESLVIALSKARSICEQSWRIKRAENDWKAMCPLLDEVLRLTREKAACLAQSSGDSLYDVLIDQYQPGVNQEQIDPIFEDLRDYLPGFLTRVLETQQVPLPINLQVAEHRQKSLALALMGKIGFAFERGRLDTSHHPFCGGDPDDTRITTRYNEANFLDSMMAVLHETGHALYEQGLPNAWRGQPVGQALGMAMHESQSLLMEMQVCRGDAFMEFAAPIIQQELGVKKSDLGVFSAPNLLIHSTGVERGYIRVDADEVTYPLHVILRYELEKALVSGDLKVAELPAAWNEKMTAYLGLSTQGNDKDGCMQDVHWYAGLFGYFQTYSLGAVAAAQIYASAVKQDIQIVPGIRCGNFRPLLGWLRKNIHGMGRLVLGMELLESITGMELNTSAFRAHLETRYLR